MNTPIACLIAPKITQPGPAMITARHQERLFAAVLGGLNRR